MKFLKYVASILFSLTVATFAQGHGTPITAGIDSGQLVVTHEPEPVGYPPHILVEESDVGDPFGSFTLPSVGPVVVWQVPGFEISGMDDQSSLSIEVLPRTVQDSNPTEERVLWYWNPETELVEAAPRTQAFYLLGTGMRYATLASPDGPAPPSFELASSMTGQQGFHNHGLLSYALGNSPAADMGAYGIFARLTSNLYEPSDPFLIVFNYGVDYAQMVPAALAIDAAAIVPNAGNFLAGDYNGNGLVDAADYSVWRDALMAASTSLLNDPTPGTVDESDFTYWRDHYGEVLGAGAGVAGSASASSAVPEPTGALLATVAAALITLLERRSFRDCVGRLTA